MAKGTRGGKRAGRASETEKKLPAVKAETEKKTRGHYNHINYDEEGEFREDWAINDVMNETGMSKREATEYVHEVSAFSGADYENFTAGYRKAEEEIINNGLLKSQPFNGTMYRGIALDDVDYYAFIENVEVGSTMRMKSISSWSSNIDVAVGYSAQQDIGNRRVIFVNKKNKTASSIKHMSSVPSEDEVLAPSTAKWKVTEIKSSSDSLGRYTLVEVEEI